MTRPDILVCGAGSIGRRHIMNLQRLGARVSAWRARGEARDALAREFDIPVHADIDAAIAGAEAVVVATSTDAHLPIALAAARSGKAIFLEKPVAHTWEGVEELAAAAAGLTVEIGCQLRSHPCLRALADRLAAGADGRVQTFRAAVGQRLSSWRPGTDYRTCYSADAGRGGGALFDLVHELDLVHWLVGDIAAISASLDRISDLEITAEDLANLTVHTAAGAVGQVQLDMLSPAYRRNFELVASEAIYRFDDVEGTLTRISAEARETIAAVPPGFERNDLFMAHMSHFLRRLEEPDLPPICSLDDGIAVLGAALAARRSHAQGGGRVSVGRAGSAAGCR